MVYYIKTRDKRKQYNQYRLNICRELSIRELDYNAFRRLGQQLNLLYTRRCNGYTQDFFEKQDIQREKLLTEKAEKRAFWLSLNIYFQTDPRGGTIYLSKEPIPENNYTIASLIY